MSNKIFGVNSLKGPAHVRLMDWLINKIYAWAMEADPKQVSTNIIYLSDTE